MEEAEELSEEVCEELSEGPELWEDCEDDREEELCEEEEELLSALLEEVLLSSAEEDSLLSSVLSLSEEVSIAEIVISSFSDAPESVTGLKTALLSMISGSAAQPAAENSISAASKKLITFFMSFLLY